MSLPLVSVVTPSCNQGAYLEETIRSVLSQDYPRLEYLIIDGGSTDGSVDIIRRHADRLAYWVCEPDRGQSDAINRGWMRARGTILAWINSDDTYAPGAVRTAVEALQARSDVYLVYGDLRYMDAQGRTLFERVAPDFDLRTFIGERDYIPQPTVFFRREVLDVIGMLNASYQYAMDYEFFIRLCARFPVLHIPRLMANFRIHPEAKAIAGGDSETLATLRILEWVAGDHEFTPEVRALAWRRIGLHHYERRQTALARRMFSKAVATHRPSIADPTLLSCLAKSLLGGRLLEAGSRARRRMSRRR